jgi:hypothetical protein
MQLPVAENAGLCPICPLSHSHIHSALLHRHANAYPDCNLITFPLLTYLIYITFGWHEAKPSPTTKVVSVMMHGWLAYWVAPLAVLPRDSTWSTQGRAWFARMK